MIAAKKVAVFKASKKLSEQLNGAGPASAEASSRPDKVVGDSVIRVWLISLGLSVCVSVSAVAGEQAAAEAPLQLGWTSWYGEAYHGRRTASGEVYNMHKLTAAHRDLPFGTRVRVTHTGSQRSLVVRINDRGPFVGNRILDLSYAAAGRLGIVRSGLAMIRLELLESKKARPDL